MLTDAKVRVAKPREKSYKLTDSNRLHLLVTSSGGKLWRWNYDYDGKQRTMAFGAYPLLSLADARVKRDEAYTTLCEGHDPNVVKRLKVESNIEAGRQTSERIARNWHENATPQWAKVHASDVICSLERDVFPSIGTLPIAQLTPPIILGVLGEIEARGSIETARRIRQRISATFLYPVSLVASTLGVGRPTVYDRLTGSTTTRRFYAKAGDPGLLPRIRQTTAQRPTCGYRLIAAVLNRQFRAEGLAPANHKRVYRIMAADRLLLARCYTERSDYGHDGVVVAIRSNLRWCSDGFEFTCWNGEVVRGAFIIDAHDRGIIAFAAVANAGISGSHIGDIMLEAVETRFGGMRATKPVEMLSDNGSAYTARETRTFARQLCLKPCFTPVRSPQSNGIPEAFVHTLKRNYVRVSRLPDASTALTSFAGWIEDYNDHRPHSELKNAFAARASRTGFSNRLGPSGEPWARSPPCYFVERQRRSDRVSVKNLIDV